MEGPGLGSKLLVREDGTRSGGLGDAELETAADEAGARARCGPSAPRRGGWARRCCSWTPPTPTRGWSPSAPWTTPPRCASSRAAAGLAPVRVRPAHVFATRERFPEAEKVVAAWPEEAFEAIGGIDRATYVCVLTHDPKLDDAALGIALRSDAAYVGAMGSTRAQEARRERLLAAGLHRAGAGAPGRADRAGPGRHRAGGDGAVDHGRGGGRAERPRGRPAARQAGRPHPRGLGQHA